MTSTNPFTYNPFACALCGRQIAARRWHIVLTPLSALSTASPAEREAAAAAIVCAACQDLPDAHSRLFPECAVASYCDLYDHGHTIAADRAAANLWLNRHGRIQPRHTDTTDLPEGERST